jgi:WXG100 family type VII secretion target
MSTIGAQMDQLDSLRNSFNQNADTVGQLVTAIGSQVQGTWWKGGAADRFRSSWETEYAPTMRRLEVALREASEHIRKKHSDLQTVGG